MKFLNLGCGSRCHKQWVNLDITAVKPYVQACDLRFGIPFPDQTFDLVYHSHLLEHFSQSEGLGFLKECCRVMKPGCVIRVVVPDLENITRLYIQSLEESLKGSEQGRQRYKWMLLELYDQTVRNRSGGEMIDFLQQDPLPDRAFILQRLGGEVKKILEARENATMVSRWQRIMNPKNWFMEARARVESGRDMLYRLILSRRDYQALVIGRFRLSGEIHQWMYDRHSLAQVLLQTGFHNPVQQTPTSSLVPGWADFNLDTEPDGTIYKPDSLYMEAIKQV
jgi:hypothetical protein